MATRSATVLFADPASALRATQETLVVPLDGDTLLPRAGAGVTTTKLRGRHKPDQMITTLSKSGEIPMQSAQEIGQQQSSGLVCELEAKYVCNEALVRDVTVAVLSRHDWLTKCHHLIASVFDILKQPPADRRRQQLSVAMSFVFQASAL